MTLDPISTEHRWSNRLAALLALAFAAFLLVLYVQLVQAAVAHATMKRHDASAEPRAIVPAAEPRGDFRDVSADAVDLLAPVRPEAGGRRAARHRERGV